MPNNILLYPPANFGGGGGPPPPPGTDIYGPTRIVSNVVSEGTDVTIASALSALVSTGGYIQIKPGTYANPVTNTMPDKSIVVRGSGDSTIIDLGASAVAAFTVPTLTAKRSFVFEDFKVTGTSVAGQKIWSIGDPGSRGAVFGRRINSSGVQFPVHITNGSGAPDFEPLTIDLDDCHFAPLADGSSILINTVAFIGITANVYLQRIRFYDVFLDAIAGTLTAGGDFVDFTGVNILGEDNLFAVATDCTVGAINLTDSVIFNFTPNPNPKIAVADDNNGVIPSTLVGCESQFVDFDIGGNGTTFQGGNYRSCSFTDGAISRFNNCLFFTDVTTPAVIAGSGSTLVTNCRFDNKGLTLVLDGNFNTISGNVFASLPSLAVIRITNGNADIFGNRFPLGSNVPILEQVSSKNVISGNYFPSNPPTLLATTPSLSNVFQGVPTVGPVFTQTADQTVANTGAETTLTAAGVGTLTLPLKFLTVGKSLKITARGFVSDVGTPTYRVRVKLGGTLILDTGTVTFAGAISNNEWGINALITCRSVGVAGTVAAQGVFEVESNNRAGMVNTAPVVVNTTVTQLVDVTFQWGAIDPSDTITCTNLVLEAV